MTALTTYRYGPWLERGLVAAGLAGALLASRLLPGFYPAEWWGVLTALVLGLGLWAAPAGYFAAVAVAAVPLWAISPYLAVLFLAVAVIPHRIILQHLPLVLLVVWSPAFITLHLELALPILVGLLGGRWRGAIAGASSALWFKLLAALSGTSLDLLAMQTPPGDAGRVAARFTGLGSLDTLVTLAAPFAPSSVDLLVHVLQIGSWAAAGAVAGALAQWGGRRLLVGDLQETPSAWQLVGGRFFWQGLVPVLAALAVLVGLAFLVPVLVARPLGDAQLAVGGAIFAPRAALAGGVLLLLMALIVISQPLPAGTRRWQRTQRPRTTPAPPTAARKVALPARPTASPVLASTSPSASRTTPVAPAPKRDASQPFVPSWAANRVLPVPPPGGSSADYAREGAPPVGGRPERDILIELD